MMARSALCAVVNEVVMKCHIHGSSCCCCCVLILLKTFPSNLSVNVSIAAVRGAVRPSNVVLVLVDSL